MGSINIKGILLTTIGAACWGLSGSVGQYLFDIQGMDSRWLVPLRLGLSGILILIYCFFRHGKKTFAPWKSRKKAVVLLIYGIAGVSACQFFYFLTIELSNAAVGTILQDLAPIFILAFTCITLKRAPKTLEIVSIIIAILGVFLLTTHGDLSSLSVSKGALIAGVASAFCVMIYNVLAPRLTNDIPVIIAQGWSFLLGGIVTCLLFRSWTIHYVPNLYGILGIIFVIAVGNICAFTLYISGVKEIGPQKASLYSFAEPITAAIISTTVLHSPFTIWDVLGFALIFIMLWLITVAGRKESGL